jgi:hypothetical protein
MQKENSAFVIELNITLNLTSIPRKMAQDKGAASLVGIFLHGNTNHHSQLTAEVNRKKNNDGSK